jgi:hypothetical protein
MEVGRMRERREDEGDKLNFASCLLPPASFVVPTTNPQFRNLKNY